MLFILANLTVDWPRHAGKDQRSFQQDGAPPHYIPIDRDFLDTPYADQWIGRRGAIELLARSLDLNFS